MTKWKIKINHHECKHRYFDNSDIAFCSLLEGKDDERCTKNNCLKI